VLRSGDGGTIAVSARMSMFGVVMCVFKYTLEMQ
jgi:hypothetical protein